MDDEYGSSENEQDELMEEQDELDPDNDAEEENEDEDEEQEEQEEPDQEPEPEPDQEPEPEATESFDETAAADGQRSQTGTDGDPAARRASAAGPSSPLIASKWRPMIRQEYLTAPLYDIVPTMAAPQATSINAIAITPDLRYWITGGSDGYIRKYDGMGTINGRQQLTVAQKHPFVDSVVKAGILMSYWENEEPAPPSARADERILSPVYSLAVHKDALWLLSGLESGGINLQSVRHDEGKRIHCLREGGHTNAVSVLQLAPDEKSVVSGGWDKSIIDWDLNTGGVIRRFDGNGGQISAVELRPACGAPVPAEASEPDIKSETFDGNNNKPPTNSFFMNGSTDDVGASSKGLDMGGPPSDHDGSLFGSPAGSLFGDNDTMGGGGAFGNDEDDGFSGAMDMGLNDDSTQGMGQPTDFPMADGDVNGVGVSTAAPVTGQENGDIASGSTTQAMDISQGMGDTQVPPGSQIREQIIEAPAEPPPHPANMSPKMIINAPLAPGYYEPTQVSPDTFLSAAIDGVIRIWDRRVQDPVARIATRRGVPPWCMGACWNPDGNWIYAGRRNGTVEEFSIHKARSGWEPERVLKFPAGSGAVSCVRPMPNGRHLICASHDILRLYDLRENAISNSNKHSKVPFIIVPGPPRAGVISTLYLDPSSRIMISAAGTRGWDGTSTEVLIGYEIGVAQ
ncbi:SPT8-like protein [Echria macrotheca]|uniref:SPT8-like protein n=1 Tax=Echria macrotheca TaxID=438768 RepID=A0AAJ0B2D6_9PEZI|nr:SPT8-like protein [Echria macrotheca]